MLGLWLLAFPFRTDASTASSFFFFNITVADGLSSNMTSSIVQDQYGFVWIGTQEGLCRHDGYKILQFHSGGEEHTLSSDNVSALLLDDDQIWVGTWDGLNVMDIKSYENKRLDTGRTRVVRTLFKDAKGRIWVGTSEGILIFEKDASSYHQITTANSGLSHNMIRSFYQSSNGDMWIGTYDGLNRYRNGKITSYNLKGSYKPLLQNNLICSIVPSFGNQDSLLWVGTETGLALFDTYRLDYHLYNYTNTHFSNEVIKTIYAPNDSLLMLGTDFGLNVFNFNKGYNEIYYHDPLIDNTIVSNVIWEIFEDQQKRLWLITSNGVSIVDHSTPLYQLHETYYSQANPRIGNQIRDILVASDNHIWLATIHGVVHHDLRKGTKRTFSSTSIPRLRILLDNVYSLQEDHLGRIWMGTAGGMNVWDEAHQKMYALTANKQNGLTSNYISNFYLQEDGTVWLTAWEGGFYKGTGDSDDPMDIQFQRVDDDGDGRMLMSDSVIYYGSRNKLWQFDSKSLQKRAVNVVNDYIGNRPISGMALAKNGNLWIGIENLLIQYFPDEDSLASITIDTGGSQKLMNLQVDMKGDIWATTQRSIIRVMAESSAYITIPIYHNSPIKSFYPYASAISGAGHLLFGGDNGFIEIDPDLIHISDARPEVFITSLSLNNEMAMPVDGVGVLDNDMAFIDRLNLKYHQNSVTFEFSILDYLFTDVSQYSYRLLPEQDQWSNTSGDKNFAVFANLKPGRYSFEIKGANHLGIWSEVKRVDIRISPSIWLSKGFIALYILLIMALTYLVFRIYSYRQRLNGELQLVRLEQQHSEAMYQSKIQFFTNISHEFRTPLSLIIPPIQELLNSQAGNESQSRMLQMAHRNAQRLFKLVNQLLDFRKIESSELVLRQVKVNLNEFLEQIFHSFDDMASRHEVDYRFEAPETPLIADVDDEKIETIVFNLLSNAFKYTPFNGEVVLKVFRQGDQIRVLVNDSGPGIPIDEQDHIFDQFYQTATGKSKKAGSGLGLTLSKEYARLLKGSLMVNSAPGQGSVFELTFPYQDLPHVEWLTATDNMNPTKSFEVAKTASDKQVSLGSKRIVLVDDNEDILDFMELNLRGTYQVFCATNGQQGLELTARVHPHLIISDVMMPVMDGFELCMLVKQNKASAHIPVILLTAKSLDLYKTEGMEMGADMYITKPFDMDYLKSCISSVFRRDKQLEDFFTRNLVLNPSHDGERPGGGEELFLKKVMAIIDNNISNPDLSVEMISSEIGFSATHLYRKLKQYTGYSTKEIISNYRMQKAADMIEHNSGNITETMYAVGFSSLASFSRSFKVRFGVAPSAYVAGEHPDAVIPSRQNP